ncbi:MAG: TIGR00266 family protein [Thermoanaerobaculia bacterium]|nr:TIGR00266 family protein [Thermoanaerobaculia bacterium]
MSDKVWYTAVGGQQQGPFSLTELLPRFQNGELARDTYVFTQGMDNWTPAGDRPEFQSAFGASPSPAPVIPTEAPVTQPVGQEAHEIDYEIFGQEMQYVEITLDPREACIAEAGAFLFMDPGIEMETMFGDGSAQSQTGGVMGMLMSAGKRVLTGESLFMTVFGNAGAARQKVAFASPYPGTIIPADLREHGRTLICQKDAFLCAAKGISVGIAFQKKLWSGLFGGEGFILQKLEGDGLTFLHAGGCVSKKTLAAGEVLRIDTGCLVAFEAQVDYDIQLQRSIKTGLFGGEGLFLATLTGPGNVWIQSLPFSRLARKVFAAAPQAGGKDRGEGSVLGGIGDLMMGNR